MQQSCEFKGMSHFCCLIALLPVVPFIATGKILLNISIFQINVFKLLLKMETETILWSKHEIILVIINFKLILAILRHQRPLQGSN
jgi:hypothetical protein